MSARHLLGIAELEVADIERLLRLTDSFELEQIGDAFIYVKSTARKEDCR